MEIPNFVLDDFRLDLKHKKHGGEAIIFIGSHDSHGQVAVKEWHGSDHGRKNEISLKREIEILMKNPNHQHIIKILGFLLDEKSKCIGYVMPYMAIGSLEDVIHNKGKNHDDIYTDGQKTTWITKTSLGLSHLHSKNIIHRDIKPSNILLGRSYDDVKLSDFGIARSLKNITHTLTAGCGTHLYTAPEILDDEKYDISADIYSLAITIWEILHRRTPFDHVTVKRHKLSDKIIDGERPQLKNDISEEMSNFLRRCWHANASKRPTINYIIEFFNNTRFSPMDLKNPVNECTISSENVNGFYTSSTATVKRRSVYNKNNKALTVNTAESTNVQNYLTDVSTIGNLLIYLKPLLALNNNLSSPKFSPRKSNASFDIPPPIGKKPEIQTILLLGGDDGRSNDSLLMLDNTQQNWKQLNITLPYAIYSHGAQFINSNLYIFGGYNGKEGVFSCTYKLSKSLKWEKMADMNQKRQWISNSSVTLNSQIWVCGGGNEKEELKSVEMYDPETNKWKYTKEMNECRKDPAAAIVNGKIFCCGGLSKMNVSNSVECYDPSSDVWTRISEMPQKIYGHGAVEMNGNFIVFGGSIGVLQYSSKVWALDTRNGNAVWIEKPSMSIPHSGLSIAKLYGTIFVCGGEVELDKSTDSVEIFDREVWKNGPKMPTYRVNAPTVVIPMSFARDLE